MNLWSTPKPSSSWTKYTRIVDHGRRFSTQFVPSLIGEAQLGLIQMTSPENELAVLGQSWIEHLGLQRSTELGSSSGFQVSDVRVKARL